MLALDIYAVSILYLMYGVTIYFMIKSFSVNEISWTVMHWSLWIEGDECRPSMCLAEIILWPARFSGLGLNFMSLFCWKSAECFGRNLLSSWLDGATYVTPGWLKAVSFKGELHARTFIHKNRGWEKSVGQDEGKAIKGMFHNASKLCAVIVA